MTILIDPPVGPYSPRPELEQWLAELQEMRTKYKDDAEALKAIDRSVAEVRQWLDWQETPPEPGVQ